MDSTTGRGGASAAGSTERKTRIDASDPPSVGRDRTAHVDRRLDSAPARGPLRPTARPGK